MVNGITGTGNMSSSWTVAETASKKVPNASGGRPQPTTVKICSEDPNTFIQSISSAFGYREAGMLTKDDLSCRVSVLAFPAETSAVLKDMGPKEIAQRDALIDKLTDETWGQLIDKGYIDASGAIQDKFRNISVQDFVLSFSGGEKSRIPQATTEIFDVLKKSGEGKMESHISSSYILEKGKAGFEKLPYKDVMLLLSSLQVLGYVSSSTPGAKEKDTREKLIEGLTKFQAKHPEIQVSVEDKGNRVGPATINALVQELKTLK